MAKGGAKPGERRGGRQAGVPNRARREDKIAIEDLAKKFAPSALQALAHVATKGESEAARVSASVALLDRGYGKPRQALEHTGPDGGPVQFQQVRRVIFDPRKPDDAGDA